MSVKSLKNISAGAMGESQPAFSPSITKQSKTWQQQILHLTTSYNAPNTKDVYGCAIVEDLIDAIFSAG